jgi:hypothetical protein
LTRRARLTFAALALTSIAAGGCAASSAARWAQTAPTVPQARRGYEPVATSPDAIGLGGLSDHGADHAPVELR